MKSFRQFIAEAYDPDVQGRSQIRKQGEGGRIGRERKKTAPERKRTIAVGKGKTAPAKSYKARKDIGTQKPRSEREQQPTRKKELEKAATKLLTKKKTKPAADPNYKPHKASGFSHAERQKIRRSGQRLVRDIQKKKEKPISHYDPKL